MTFIEVIIATEGQLSLPLRSIICWLLASLNYILFDNNEISVAEYSLIETKNYEEDHIFICIEST